MRLSHIDATIISWLQRSFLPIARFSIFIVYFYFGFLKLIGLSSATPLATELTNRTIGADAFDTAFMALAIFECLIGVLFLIPKAIRFTIPLLFIHLAVVCSPLVLVPDMVWHKFFVPSLEGQYIIKNVVIAAVAIGIAAQTKPLKR